VTTAAVCSTSTLCIAGRYNRRASVALGAVRFLPQNCRRTATLLPHIEPPSSRGEGQSPHVVQIRVSLPVTISEWVATEAHAVGLSKSSFIRMVILQFKAHVSDDPDD
jgi:hypothetical protein